MWLRSAATQPNLSQIPPLLPSRPEFRRVGPSGVGRVGPPAAQRMVFLDLPLGEAPVRPTEKWRKWYLPQSHTNQSPNTHSAQTSTPSSLLLLRV